MSEETELPKLLTSSEVAKVVRRSDSTVRRWCETGVLPGIKIGRNWLVDQAKLENLVKPKLGRRVTYKQGGGPHGNRCGGYR